MEQKLICNSQYIDFYLQENNITKKEFAKKCNITQKELNSIYNQELIDIDVLIKVVKVLQITSDTFLFREKSYPKKIIMI